MKVLADDKKEKKKIDEIDEETRRALESAPQVNERPGPLDLRSGSKTRQLTF